MPRQFACGHPYFVHNCPSLRRRGCRDLRNSAPPCRLTQGRLGALHLYLCSQCQVYRGRKPTLEPNPCCLQSEGRCRQVCLNEAADVMEVSLLFSINLGCHCLPTLKQIAPANGCPSANAGRLAAATDAYPKVRMVPPVRRFTLG